MKTIFRQMDLDKDGYLTYSDLDSFLQLRLSAFPDLDIESERQQQRKVWIEIYNGGKDVPDDYRLSEANFVDNMWKVVKEPRFRQFANDMAKKALARMDTQNKGYVSKDGYVKVAGKLLGLDKATACFDCMDIKKSGRVNHEEIMDAVFFYYTDTDDEVHPLNYMNGPLAE